jgi:hypothetical protein
VKGEAEHRTLAGAEDTTPIDHVDVAAHPAWPRLTTALPRPALLAFFPATTVSISIVRPGHHRRAHHGHLGVPVPRMVKAGS